LYLNGSQVGSEIFLEAIMKRFTNQASVLLMCLASTAVFAGAGSMALSTKDLSDDVRASIAKEMAKAKQFKDERKDKDGNPIEDDGTSGSRTSSGCQMDVGSTEKPRAGQRAPARTVTIVQGNVIQMCNK
jgi:hypothetical protein